MGLRHPVCELTIKLLFENLPDAASATSLYPQQAQFLKSRLATQFTM